MDNIDLNFIWNGKEYRFYIQTRPDSKVDHDLRQELKAYYLCEPELTNLLLRALRPGDVFIDGGANIGFFTLLAHVLGAHVVAYEPAEENISWLRDNLALNNIMDGVVCCSEPLWSSKQELKFIHDEDPGRNSLGTTVNKPRWAEMVQTTSLDHMSPTPRVIKLDIEGAEEHALRGATTHLVDQACPYISCELNLQAMELLGSSQNSLRSFMYSHGYDTFLLHKDGSYPSFVPRGVVIEPAFLNCNILFSTPLKVEELWPRTPAM